MKTRIAAAALALLVSSCVDNRASISLSTICGLPDTGCKFGSTCDVLFGGRMYYDVGLGAGMLVPVEAHNQLPNNGDGTIKLNTNDAHVTEVLVKYDAPGLVDATGAALALPDDSSAISQTIPTNGTTVLFVSPFSPTMTAYLSGVGLPSTGQVVIAKTRVKGNLDDGSTFETGDFSIPVTVCQGCLAGKLPTCTTGTLTGYCLAQGQWPSTAICKQ